jgi:hypothetical protein
MRLLRDMRAARIFAPFIVYCGWLGPDQLASRRAGLVALGGSGVTAAPRELLRWTVGELICASYDPKAEFVETPLYPDEGGTPQRPTSRTATGRRPQPRDPRRRI